MVTKIRPLQGRLVTLIPATIHDREDIFKWLAQSDSTHRMLGPPDFPDNLPPSWEEFISDYNAAFFNDTNEDHGRSYIIKSNKERVGQINYNDIDRNTNMTELDIWLAGNRYCNKGYGSDAIQTLCHFLADELECKTIFIAPSSRNIAAVKAYEKCGFRISDLHPVNFIPDYPDAVVMTKEF